MDEPKAAPRDDAVRFRVGRFAYGIQQRACLRRVAGLGPWLPADSSAKAGQPLAQSKTPRHFRRIRRPSSEIPGGSCADLRYERRLGTAKGLFYVAGMPV
jgi:hypothetical protein